MVRVTLLSNWSVIANGKVTETKEIFKVITKYNAGFLPGHSTVYQLIETYYIIVKCIDDEKSCCLVFSDLSKACNRVWHKGSLLKNRNKRNNRQWFTMATSNVQRRFIIKYLYKIGYIARFSVRTLPPFWYMVMMMKNMLLFCRVFADDNLSNLSNMHRRIFLL